MVERYGIKRYNGAFYVRNRNGWYFAGLTPQDAFFMVRYMITGIAE